MSNDREARLPEGSFVALSGGVGGAKLALGLSKALPSGRLTVVANNGDDFEHVGLQICPDLDTVMYTLAGISNQETGWGRADETWSFMTALGQLGGETWFRVGDRDLALHVERTRRLAAGESLTRVTGDFCKRLGLENAIVPMTNDIVRTVVHTENGPLPFQHYFVRDRCAPKVTGFHFEGIERASPSPGVTQALGASDLEAVIVCPSNPFVSIAPIFGLPGVRASVTATGAPVVAVSPIVGGQAIKGPAAKMMEELGMPATALEVARHYKQEGLLDGFVIDRSDKALGEEIEALGAAVLVTQTVMDSLGDRITLADQVLDFARRLRRG